MSLDNTQWRNSKIPTKVPLLNKRQAWAIIVFSAIILIFLVYIFPILFWFIVCLVLFIAGIIVGDLFNRMFKIDNSKRGLKKQ